jgi:hypothetical protein
MILSKIGGYMRPLKIQPPKTISYVKTKPYIDMTKLFRTWEFCGAIPIVTQDRDFDPVSTFYEILENS